MASGFAPYLLKSIAEIAKENNPEFTLDPAGAFNVLQMQKSAEIVSVSPNNNGHRREVRVKSQQRATPNQVTDTISCDNVIVPTYNEATVAIDIVKQLGIYISDETVAKYMDDASRSVAVGLPPTQMMQEFIFSVMTSTNALVQELDTAILTKLQTNVGVNVVSGNANATAINIVKNTTVNPLNDGMTKVFADYLKNGFKGRPQILGAGLVWDWFLQQPAKGLDYAGIDSRIQAARLDFYPDLNFETVFAADQALIIAPNTIQKVEYLTNQGFRAGNKGVSQFGVITLPMQVGEDILPIKFDFQLKYIDCPTELTEAYTGATITAERGYALFISKQMGVYQIPANSYSASDRLAGVRGTLLYEFSNDCENCPA